MPIYDISTWNTKKGVIGLLDIFALFYHSYLSSDRPLDQEGGHGAEGELETMVAVLRP